LSFVICHLSFVICHLSSGAQVNDKCQMVRAPLPGDPINWCLKRYATVFFSYSFVVPIVAPSPLLVCQLGQREQPGAEWGKLVFRFSAKMSQARTMGAVK
jgi:hypothetical protein